MGWLRGEAGDGGGEGWFVGVDVASSQKLGELARAIGAGSEAPLPPDLNTKTRHRGRSSPGSGGSRECSALTLGLHVAAHDSLFVRLLALLIHRLSEMPHVWP